MGSVVVKAGATSVAAAVKVTTASPWASNFSVVPSTATTEGLLLVMVTALPMVEAACVSYSVPTM